MGCGRREPRRDGLAQRHHRAALAAAPGGAELAEGRKLSRRSGASKHCCLNSAQSDVRFGTVQKLQPIKLLVLFVFALFFSILAFLSSFSNERGNSYKQN